MDTTSETLLRLDVVFAPTSILTNEVTTGSARVEGIPIVEYHRGVKTTLHPVRRMWTRSSLECREL
jgi:hypothetical protein